MITRQNKDDYLKVFLEGGNFEDHQLSVLLCSAGSGRDSSQRGCIGQLSVSDIAIKWKSFNPRCL